jgi:hypothetical protein
MEDKSARICQSDLSSCLIRGIREIRGGSLMLQGVVGGLLFGFRVDSCDSRANLQEYNRGLRGFNG